jgi:solute carrier family 35 protein E1
MLAATGKVSPMTHAVGNAVKRVVIILAAVVLLNNPITFQGAVGSGIAVFGTFLYSLSMNAAKAKSRVEVKRIQYRDARSIL